MTVWQNRMFCEYLAKRPYGPYPQDTREIQLSPSCPDSSHSSHVQVTCITSRDAYSRATRKNTSVFNLPWVFTLSFSLTQPLQINPTWNTGYKTLNRITIKFGMKLKPTKHIVVNYNFTISPFGYSITKPLKQTLDLNVSLGTVAKLIHTKSRICEALAHIYL